MHKFHFCIVAFITAIMIVGMAPFQNACGMEITLRVGESIILKEYALQIGFDGILADSRCPEDALCFWEGDAIAQIWADRPSRDRLVFKLHTHHGFQWQARHDNYLITLIKVEPYPRTDREIDPNEYTVILSITDVLTPVDIKTWSRIKTLF